MNIVSIEYTASVFTDAGWRPVTIEADAEQISPGFAVVKAVKAIDGETPRYGMSRTGAKRQSYNGKAIAEREIGKKKRLSACSVRAHQAGQPA